ncbi:NmrA family NAD(P)-binding protein [Phycicoccus avicenniae]|uniref:NmrA family NAD(P)-binding protein n=1 Tax=Phycicoccus avicenniae TaxID=2828860 RepID=UPI003D29050E
MTRPPVPGPVAVLGATGRQGGAVVRHLLRRGIPVRAVSRAPDGSAARWLAREGAEVVGANQVDEASLRVAFRGVRALFSVQDFYGAEGGPAGEVDQGRAVAQAARWERVPVVVQSTMAAGQDVAAVPHFLSKRRVETELLRVGVPHVLLGTVWFMDNLFDPAVGGMATLPVMAGALGRHAPVAALAVDDIGAVAAAVLADPEPYLGGRLDLVGDRLSVAQMIDLLRRAEIRVPAWAVVPLPALMAAGRAPEFVQQLRWQRRQGFQVRPAPLLDVPRLRSFSEFLRGHRSG